MFRPGVAQRGNEMYTSLAAAAMLAALLVVMFYCARMLLPLISPVIVMLLSFVGIHVPAPGFDSTAL
jgi:hypothetical protein